MYWSVTQPIRIARSSRVLLVLFATMAFHGISVPQALADHTTVPFGPPVPPMSESFLDGPVEVGTLTDLVIIDHAIGGIGGHAVFAKTVLGNHESEPHQVSCELRTTSGNFDTVTVTIPPRWTPSRGPSIAGSVSVSLQAIDRPMASIAHFARLTCRAIGGLFVSPATMSKVWAIAVQN